MGHRTVVISSWMIVLALALALDPAGADVSDDLRVEVDTDPIIIDDGLAKVQFSVNNTGPEPLFVEFRHSTPSNDSPIRASFTVTAGRVDFWACNGFATRSMPQMGQEPGLSLMICGCMGQR